MKKIFEKSDRKTFLYYSSYAMSKFRPLFFLKIDLLNFPLIKKGITVIAVPMCIDQLYQIKIRDLKLYLEKKSIRASFGVE